MSEDIKRKIIDYLATHSYLALGTAGPDGNPSVHTMGYVAIGATVFCISLKDTEKMRHIKQNPNVSYVVDEDYDNPLEIKGIQVKGIASLPEEKEEIDRAVSLIIKKFPEFAATGPESIVVIFKIEPVEGAYIDYGKGVGHRDWVKL